MSSNMRKREALDIQKGGEKLFSLNILIPFSVKD
jgi:hypothetical protein